MSTPTPERLAMLAFTFFIISCLPLVGSVMPLSWARDHSKRLIPGCICPCCQGHRQAMAVEASLRSAGLLPIGGMWRQPWPRHCE